MDYAIYFLLIVCGFAGLYRQLQMLQQNSYFPSRYFKWVRESYLKEIICDAVLFVIFPILYFLLKPVLAVILSLLLIIRLFTTRSYIKKSIKKLVFTKRVIRQIIAIALIYIIMAILFFAIKDSTPRRFLYEILTLLCLFTPIVTLIMWLITKPVEDLLGKFYINDAKKILKNHNNLKVIGVTGSFGKTSVKFILNDILSQEYNTLATPGSFNTPFGVVRTVREQLKPQTEIFICEMGAKNIGDIKEICDIAHPDLGVVTSVGPQHLDTFKSIDNVFATKFELYDECIKNNGIVFANIDSKDLADRISQKPKTILTGADTPYHAENITYNMTGSQFDLILDGKIIPVKTKLLGAHNVSNIVLSAAVAKHLGVSDEKIKRALFSLKPTPHRLELKAFANGKPYIDDAYNSNPVGCLEAVRILGCFEGYKKVIITPGLIELGDKEYEANYNLGLQCAKYCDYVILVGKNRSKPMLDALKESNYNTENTFVAESFATALSKYNEINEKAILLIENDLPDNYLN